MTRSRQPKVGYGRPPTEHQWKPGQSGNPAGKRKSNGTAEEAMEVFGGERVVKVGNSLVAISNIRALYRDMFIRAISGKKVALRRAVELIISEFPKPPEGWKPEPAAHFDREATVREISQAIRRRMGCRTVQSKANSGGES